MQGPSKFCQVFSEFSKVFPSSWNLSELFKFIYFLGGLVFLLQDFFRYYAKCCLSSGFYGVLQVFSEFYKDFFSGLLGFFEVLQSFFMNTANFFRGLESFCVIYRLYNMFWEALSAFCKIFLLAVQSVVDVLFFLLRSVRFDFQI